MLNRSAPHMDEILSSKVGTDLFTVVGWLNTDCHELFTYHTPLTLMYTCNTVVLCEGMP